MVYLLLYTPSSMVTNIYRTKILTIFFLFLLIILIQFFLRFQLRNVRILYLWQREKKSLYFVNWCKINNKATSKNVIHGFFFIFLPSWPKQLQLSSVLLGICLYFFTPPPPLMTSLYTPFSFLILQFPSYVYYFSNNHNKWLTSFRSDCPSMTLCSCWSCSVMVLRILGELAPLTTATKTPPCNKKKKLIKNQF